MYFDKSCPNGQIMVGLDGWQGHGWLEGIDRIWCRDPNALDDGSSPGTEVKAKVGLQKGEPFRFRCGSGGVADWEAIGNEREYRSLTLTCRPLRDYGKITNEITIGEREIHLGGPSRRTATSYNPFTGSYYITGLQGRTDAGGDLITELGYYSKNFMDARKALYTTEGKVDCCLGKYPPGYCAFPPQSGGCDQFMSLWCQKNPKHPACSCIMSEMPCPNKFDSNCVSKGGYRTQDMILTPCPNVMNCNQYLQLSPGAKALATNVEQDCTTQFGGTPSPTSSSGALPPSEESEIWKNPQVLLLIFLLVLLVLGALGMVLYRSFGSRGNSLPEK